MSAIAGRVSVSASAGRLAAAGAAVALSCSTTALAHEGVRHAAHASWGPVALFVGGVVVLAASVYLDANDAVAPRLADAGVLAGLLAVLAAIPWYWL